MKIPKFAVKGNVVLCGLGSVGRGCLPLIRRHIDIGGKLVAVEQVKETAEHAKKYDAHFINEMLTKDNYLRVLGDQLTEGSFLMNMTNDVSSKDLARLAASKKSFYVDSCIEPWLGYYRDPKNIGVRTSNYFLREEMMKLKTELGPNAPTLVTAVGANPGLVSILAKQALLHVARDSGHKGNEPKTREEWASLACDLNIHGIHIAERDFQITDKPHKKNVFVNTWSVNGFINEGAQPCELGWGTMENWLPPGGKHHTFGSKAAIYMDRPGIMVRVRSWTPLEGPYLGYLITHNESISLADYFTVRHREKVLYRPTVFYAYHPSNEAMLSLEEFIGRSFKEDMQPHIMVDEITDGIDELGVLLYGHKKNAYWFGSRLSIHDTRKRIADQNATSLQVTSTILASMKWAVENPRRGLIEAEDMDYKDILKFCEPYVAPIVGEYTDWTPVSDIPSTYIKDLDYNHPWSFKNCLYSKA